MISIPEEFIPSQLLTCKPVSQHSQTFQHSQTLLEQSRRAMAKQDWARAERYALNARDASQRPGQIVDHVIALIHLADICRGVGRLGPALEYNEKAQQMLKNQSGPTHYHNRAVADYALGLIHHVLGNDSKALYWYKHAKDLFERAHLHWGIASEPDRQDQCNKVNQWISALSESINSQAAALLDGQRFNLAWFPVFRTQTPAQDDGYELVCFPATIRDVEDQIRIGDRLYTLLLPNGQPFPFPVLDFRVPHFAVEIGEDDQIWEGTLQEGDLALIREKSLSADLDEKTDQVGEGEYGDFTRDAGGVTFVSNQKYIIGGDEEGPVIGDVVAILRPES